MIRNIGGLPNLNEFVRPDTTTGTRSTERHCCRFAPSKATRSLLVDSGPNPARFRGDGGSSSMGGCAIVDREGNP
ncbi:hypothetical protein TIFTF001_033786 [Ficus carica]|uniref:Uncharacterized protein n=1 Tax=Ficus carica TaxID=3494 RepID=A0AA88DZD3_FICCA|nr:hypothetical protein TIFTF001_033786 [Ficus carica]